MKTKLNVIILGADLPALAFNFAATSYHAGANCTVLTHTNSAADSPHVNSYPRPIGHSKALREAIELANEEIEEIGGDLIDDDVFDFKVGVMAADGSVIGLTSNTSLATLTQHGISLRDYVELATGSRPSNFKGQFLNSLTLDDAFPVRTCRTSGCDVQALTSGLREFAKPITVTDIEVLDYTVTARKKNGETIRIPYDMIFGFGDELKSWEISGREYPDQIALSERVLRLSGDHRALGCYDFLYLTGTEALLTLSVHHGNIYATANSRAPWTAMLRDLEKLFPDGYATLNSELLPMYSGLITAAMRGGTVSDIEVMDVATMMQRFAENGVG